MREILFRGKRIDNGEWVYGDLVHGVKKQKEMAFIWSETEAPPPLDVSEFAVDPSTIGQHTGLKDKNGRRIFEGDIIKMSDGEIGAVAYSDDCAGYELTSGGCTLCLSQAKERLVIDNIHDNPEFFMEA